MGVPISKPDVFEDPVKTVYRSHSAGAVALAMCSWLFVLVWPFVVGLLMGGFWLKHDVFYARPVVSYQGKAALRVLTTHGNEYLWSSSEQVQTELLAGDPRFVLPFISLQQDDRDGNGKIDDMYWSLEIPLAQANLEGTGEKVVSVEFLPALQYVFEHDSLRVTDEVFVSMETAPLIHIDVPPQGVGNNVFVDGRLKFDQYQPLLSSENHRYDRIYNFSHFPSVKDVSDLSNIAMLATKYARRNETTVFEQRVVSYGGKYHMGGVDDIRMAGHNELTPTAGDSDPLSFNLDVLMRVDPILVSHVPSTAEVVKHAWVQYFALAYVVYWLFNHIRRILVKGGMVNTIAMVDGRR